MSTVAAEVPKKTAWNRPPPPYPWDDMIWTFIKGAPLRNKMMKQMIEIEPVFELREFRVMTIGSPRQTGKTEMGHAAVRSRHNARIMVQPILGAHGQSRQVPEDLEPKLLQIHHLVPAKLEGVEVLVIDNDGRPVDQYSPYAALEKAFQQNKGMFHPEFCVIHIL